MNSQTKKQRILVVDDTAENIDILIALLKTDYMMAAARSGPKALDMVLKNPPDLILLDIMMPEMDGYEVCRRLKANEATKDIPVVFITAMSEPMDEAEAFNLGAADYITKPFNPIVVGVRVRTHMNLKMKSDLLEALVSLDGLTNIYNRRKFDETLNHEWKRSVRSDTHLSLIMLDLDHFKPFNDNYGHASGDECLKKVAQSLHHALKRPEDFLARYGGEEFVVVLPATDLQGANQVGENLRQAIAGLSIPHAFSQTTDYVTVSIGVTSTKPKSVDKSPIDLIEAADKMLYQSKGNGRNQVNGKRLENC